jgi:spermidine synthase
MMPALLCTIFFISGASALIFEALWFHQAGLGFGNSIWASSLVLSGFMGGLALGNGLAARYGNRLGNPVRVYAIAELAIALTGIGLVYLLPILGAVLAPWLHPFLEQPWILNPIRLLIAFILLLIPTTAMGVTLPLLTKALTGSDPNFGRVLGRLYGWNTLGAVVGVTLGEMYLIRIFGIHGAALTAGTLNVMAATVAMWLSTQAPHPFLAPPNAGQQELHWTAGKRWLIATFLAGFGLLALEVIWFRFLLLFVFGHSVAFALMLGVVLSGIAMGGLAAAQWVRFWPDAYRFNAPIAFSAGLVCMVSYAIFPLVIPPYGANVLREVLDILRLSVPLMLPVCFLSGLLFTLLGVALRNDFASETATTGALTFTNTVGAALGSLVGGFILLPVLGMERSFFLIAMLYGGIGLFLALSSRVPRKITYATAALFLLGAVSFPFGSMERQFFQIPIKRYFEKGTERVAAVREGLTETVIYLKRAMLKRPISYMMLTNSYAIAGTDFQYRRYMKLFIYWPMAVHPHVKHALLICYGVGNSAKALTDSKSLETLDVVDISRDVLEMNDIVYPDKVDKPLNDPRVHIHIEDGRYFLQTTDRRFDLITGEPPLPKIAGVVNLYTREYFQLIYDRLAGGGIATYWLPYHSLTDVSTKAVLKAFCDVFEDCSLWNGTGKNLMMVGTRKAQGPVSEKEFTRQWNDPVVVPEMRALGFERPEQLGALFIGDADYLKGLIGDAPALIDNYPKLIEAPFSSMEGANRLIRSFTDVAASREHFSRSPFIKRLWPEPLLAASIPYFEFQRIINAYWFGALSNRDLNMNIGPIHHLLTRSELRTPVLWLLGSNSDVQGILDKATPEERALPTPQFHIGIRLIAERDYAGAVEPLARAEQLPELREDAFRLQVYALCMSGQIGRAQQLSEENLLRTLRAKGIDVQSRDRIHLEPFWSWMKQKFGIDPLKRLRASIQKFP